MKINNINSEFENKTTYIILSPDISVYKPTFSSLGSILFRITGIFLYLSWIFLYLVINFGSLLLSNYNIYCIYYFLFYSSSSFIYCILACMLFILLYHILNGIRHIFWEEGFYYEEYEQFWSLIIILLISLITPFIILKLFF